MHNGAQARIRSSWLNIERSTWWLEMFWRCNDFTVRRFLLNTTSHSKIDCFRWNTRLSQIIKSVVLCEETSTDSKHENWIAEWSICWRFLQAIADYWYSCVSINESSRLISFPPYFCNFVLLRNKLINKVIPNIIVNHKNNKWLSERAILAAKNQDVDDLNFVIQNQIVCGMFKCWQTILFIYFYAW